MAGDNFKEEMEKLKKRLEKTEDELEVYRKSLVEYMVKQDERDIFAELNGLTGKARSEKLNAINVILHLADSMSKEEAEKPIAKYLSDNEIKSISTNIATNKKLMRYLRYMDNLKSKVDSLGKIEEEVKMDKNYRAGVELLKKGKYEESYKCFDEITMMDSKQKGTWLNKGTALGELGKIDEAIVCYKIALKIDKNYEPAKHNLEMAKKKKRLEEERPGGKGTRKMEYAFATPEGTEYLPVNPDISRKKGVGRYKTGK